MGLLICGLAWFFSTYGSKAFNMKTHAIVKRSFLTLVSFFMAAFAIAQEKVDVDINAGGGGWYTSPWVWIVGAAVFILLLVALVRGGSRTDA